jgi:hypothetical protein
VCQRLEFLLFEDFLYSGRLNSINPTNCALESTRRFTSSAAQSCNKTFNSFQLPVKQATPALIS